jgi:DNA sulfur modification protein DndD
MNGAGKTAILEAITYCLYGGKTDEIYRNMNRREKAKGNANVAFELIIEMDGGISPHWQLERNSDDIQSAKV